MTAKTSHAKPTGYDRDIDWRRFAIPLGLFVLILLIPTPRSMLEVGAEYSLGPTVVKEHFAREVFGSEYAQLNQWQVQMVLMMKASIDRSSFGHAVVMGRNRSCCDKNEIATTDATLMEAAYVMVHQGARRLVVERAGEIVGVIRAQELFFEMDRLLHGSRKEGA